MRPYRSDVMRCVSDRPAIQPLSLGIGCKIYFAILQANDDGGIAQAREES